MHVVLSAVPHFIAAMLSVLPVVTLACRTPYSDCGLYCLQLRDLSSKQASCCPSFPIITPEQVLMMHYSLSQSFLSGTHRCLPDTRLYRLTPDKPGGVVDYSTTFFLLRWSTFLRNKCVMLVFRISEDEAAYMSGELGESALPTYMSAFHSLQYTT
jgi:hypothetical protein